MDEITFNAGLLAEVRATDFVARLIERGILTDPHYRIERLHRIGGDGQLNKYSADTKFDVSWSFLRSLRDLGRESAKAWLARHFEDIGERSTLDMPATLRTTDLG